MKPFLYYGSYPQRFAPCDGSWQLRTVPISLHPFFLGIRNKRKRSRMIKAYKRLGKKSFVCFVWEITPTKPEP